jgi:hypothetical protein
MYKRKPSKTCRNIRSRNRDSSPVPSECLSTWKPLAKPSGPDGKWISHLLLCDVTGSPVKHVLEENKCKGRESVKKSEAQPHAPSSRADVYAAPFQYDGIQCSVHRWRRSCYSCERMNLFKRWPLLLRFLWRRQSQQSFNTSTPPFYFFFLLTTWRWPVGAETCRKKK